MRYIILIPGLSTALTNALVKANEGDIIEVLTEDTLRIARDVESRICPGKQNKIKIRGMAEGKEMANSKRKNSYAKMPFM